MNTYPMFSIIVPVYNVEVYLSACLDSILKQSFTDYEILLINDGSTDNSDQICREYVAQDNRIHLIEKRNGGLSDARNVGINLAKGRYLIFVDSDDVLLENAFRCIYNVIKEASFPHVIISRLTPQYEDDRENPHGRFPAKELNAMNKMDMVKWMMTENPSLWPAPQYIIDRQLIVDSAIRFEKGYLHEDVAWTPKVLCVLSSFYCFGEEWYLHRIGRNGSIMSTKKAKRVTDVVELVSKSIDDPIYNQFPENVRLFVFRRLVASVFSSLSDYRLYSPEEQKKIAASLQESNHIFKYTYSMRHKLFLFAVRVFGFHRCLLALSKFRQH